MLFTTEQRGRGFDSRAEEPLGLGSSAAEGGEVEVRIQHKEVEESCGLSYMRRWGVSENMRCIR